MNDDNNTKNLLLATGLSMLVIIVWFVLFPPAEPAVDPNAPAATQTVDGTAVTPPVAAPTQPAATTDVATTPAAPRIGIDTPELKGTISLAGGRIDDLSLKQYHDTLDDTSPNVRLLEPVGETAPYYALFAWVPGGSLDFSDVPGADTVWRQVSGDTLAPGKPITLEWDSPKGLTFTRTVSVDDKYMFTVTDKVANTGTEAAVLQPYSIVARHGKPTHLKNFFVLHEGAIGRADGSLTELKYDKVADLPDFEGAKGEKKDATKDGWIGFTDHYWMTILVPEQGKPFTSVLKYTPGPNIYQTEVRQPVLTVAPGATAETTTRVFSGAKEWETIRAYEKDQNIAGFVDSIDWGWFFFLTKPIFAVLHWLHGLIGNMGLSIIALTFILKLLVLPLAYKSYVSMARMKELQPEMEALKERAGDDRQKLQKEMMQLYKDKNVNPAAGCLPILIQIPIFFSLYKVIFVTIELRHAPFFGWLKDLSAPDPSSLYNLFGWLPWASPEAGTILHMVFIGILPILLGLSMWLQQKLNPAPADPAQAAIFAWMPWIFMFMLGGFASGLVLYWITNNLITFSQQFLIMRSHGHTPDIFGNIRSTFRKKPKTAEAPAKPGKK